MRADSVTSNTYAGVAMMQTWRDLPLWERVLNIHPVALIIEVGTYLGGFSLFLASQARARGSAFYTCDNVSRPGVMSLVAKAGGEFETLDALSAAGSARIGALMGRLRPLPCLVFCDGGDKRKEMKTFAPLLQRDDVIAVHDWGTEFRPQDVPGGLEMILREECETVNALTRFFRMRRD